MFSIKKQQFSFNVCRVSIGVALSLTCCCFGFSEGKALQAGQNDYSLLRQSLSKSQRLVFAVKDSPQAIRLFSSDGNYLFLWFNASVFAQAADNRWDGSSGQQFLLQQSSYKYYFCQLHESSTGLPTNEYFSLGDFWESGVGNCKAQISRDGNNLLVANKNSIKLYEIDKTNKRLTVNPICSYTPDSGKEIIPDSITTNNGDCIDFKERNIGTSDVAGPACISDDGRRKLQDGQLYFKGEYSWGNGQNVTRGDVPPNHWAFKQFNCSNNLQYFVYCWKLTNQSRNWYYVAIEQFDQNGSYRFIFSDYILEDDNNVLLVGVTDDGKLIQWHVPKSFVN